MSVKSVTKKDFENLKIQYNKARDEKRESFIFFGEEILTDYAKYLIQYLETKLP